MSRMNHFKASFRTRSFRVGGYSVAATAIVLAIIIIANILVGALPTAVTELDITSNGLYSISQQTKDLLKQLDKDVTLYWMVQSGLEDGALQTLLERYSTGSAHITLEKVDPDLNPTFVQNYKNEEINNNGVIVTCADRYRYVDAEDIYLEQMDYETYQYVYDFDGENAITSAIDFVISEDLPKIGLVTGHGETELPEDYRRAISLENFDIEDVPLVTLDAIEEDVRILLIHTPTADITENEAAVLRTYLEQGGDLLLTTFPTETQTLPNLEALLANYGVHAVSGLVFDSDSQYNYYGTPHYLLPELADHSITQPLSKNRGGVLLPEAHGIVIDEALPEGVSVSSLLNTSGSAFSKTGAWPLSTSEKESGDIDGPFSLAAAITCPVSDSEETNIVWVGSAQLLESGVNTVVSGGNLDFFMNAVNWMCQREDRITIRPKNQDVEFLTISSGSATTLKILIVGVIPLCYLAAGVYVFIRRKRK